MDVQRVHFRNNVYGNELYAKQPNVARIPQKYLDILSDPNQTEINAINVTRNESLAFELPNNLDDFNIISLTLTRTNLSTDPGWFFSDQSALPKYQRTYPFPTRLPRTLKYLTITLNPEVEPQYIDLPVGLESLTFVNNSKDGGLPKLPRTLEHLNTDSPINTWPTIPYGLNHIGHSDFYGSRRITPDDVRIRQYNEKARSLGLPEITSHPTESEYNRMMYMDPKGQSERAFDIGMAMLDYGVSPFVAAQIADWDRNRTDDLPAMSAFDVVQLNGFMESINETRQWVKNKPKLYKLKVKR